MHFRVICGRSSYLKATLGFVLTDLIYDVGAGIRLQPRVAVLSEAVRLGSGAYGG